MNREQRRHWRRYVFGCTGLTLAERLVLLALETFADFPDGTNARPGVAILAEMCGLGERVVKAALDHGRRLGFIAQTARANPKLGLAATYRLLPAPISRCTGVHVETDFKVHETTFQGAHDDISRCTPVPTTNRDDQAIDTKESWRAADARGTRLPSDWSPPPDVVEQMANSYPHVDLNAQLDRFRDYWSDQPGAKGRKVNWIGTYRNWIRRTAEQQRPNSRRPTRSTVDEKVAGWQTLGDDLIDRLYSQPARKELR